MQMNIDKFVQELKQSLTDNLVSVVLYGSAVKGELIQKQSDVNVMIMMKKVVLADISSVEKLIHKTQNKLRLNPVFWTIDEIRCSIDVFPIEFMDILSNHKILYGENMFNNISVDTKNLRHQVEFELRTKLLRLRNEWLSVAGNKALMFNFLTGIGTSFLHIFTYAQKIANNKLEDSLAEPFRTCVRLKKKEIKYGTPELESLYEEIHNSVEKIIEVVNNC